MKKIITLLLIATLPYISGCFLILAMDCGNPDWKPFFEIDKAFFRFTTGDTQSFANKYVKDSATVLFPKELYLDYDVNFLTMSEQKSVNPFLPTAFACSPAENGANGLKKTIDKILVTTLYDYDKNYPKGALINELIFMDSKKIDEFVALQLENKADLEHYGHSFFIDHSKKINNNSNIPKPTQFEIEIVYTDGTSNKAKTQYLMCF